VWALAADTEAEAERQFASRALWRLSRDRGVYTSLPSPEEALAVALPEAERAHIAGIRERAITGTVERVANQLRDLAASMAVEEIAILTATHDPAPRRRSYELLATAFGLDQGR
jgi:alkanesulfonate monooxygenase SsuD/methylene tetrahydromethanopterin reductase-like flavin-dependent oxidoreductase (luciferase family)